jgi:AhpD family alkylhydroperoxidase
MDRTRVNAVAALPAGAQVLAQLHEVAAEAARAAGLAGALLELVRLRVSQLNGCAYCVNLHSAAARQLGEPNRRLDLLAAWRQASCFAPAERAALELAEAVTLVADGHVPDHTYRQVAQQLDDAQIAALTWVTAVVNAYNRLAVTGRVPPPTNS